MKPDGKPGSRACFVATYPPRECGIATFTYDLRRAMAELRGEAQPCVIALTNIDADFLSRLHEEGFGEVEEATARMRQKAEGRLQEIIQGREGRGPRFDFMVVVGKPFAEILRLAVDLDFEMIILGTHGRRHERIEELLFGSTAEKVLRAAHIPVLCVPDVTVN